MVERAQAVLDELNTDAKLYVEGIMNGKRERENVWESVEDEISARIDEAIRASDRIEKSVNAVQSHKAKLEGLEDLMKVYQDLLGEEAKYEEIQERIEFAVGEVQKKMSELQSQQAAVTRQVSTKAAYKRSPFIDAAVAVLTAAGKDMTFREIAEKAMEAGLYKGNCKDPVRSFSSCMNKAIAKGDGRVVRVGNGVYGLAA